MHAFALSFLLFAGQDKAVSPEDIWPQWRGPTQDSVSPCKTLPTKWSKTDNVVWKAALPGWGNSTPAIWLDAIFLTTQDTDRLLLLRLDRRTGKILWQREVGKGTPRRNGPVGNGKYHDENNMASPSPVTDGQHVWVHFGNGDVACYDFAGEKKWAFNFIERYGAYSIWWGHANSPVLFGDLLLSVCMQDPKGGGKSYVVAHDKLTGQEKWFTNRETGATSEPADAYTTPLLLTRAGKTELIVFGGLVLDAYDPATGKQLWLSKPFKGNRVISSPTIAGDTIYAVDGMKNPAFAIRAGGGGEGDVTATSVLWKFKGATPDAASPVAVNGLVFLANNEGLIICLEAADGKLLWSERLADRFRATPLVVGDKVYFFGKEGKTTVIEAARELKVVARSELSEDVIASPAVAGGNLYLRTKGHLYRIGDKKEPGR